MDTEQLNFEKLVNELSNSLAENFFETVRILSSITETTEKYYDGGHSRFVSDKSALIAEQLGMNDEDIIEVKIAALLHDIGKIGFPETLLFKYPFEMSQQEYLNYIKHAEFGYNILRQSKLFSTIAEIVYQHHEKIDGSGFPRHLQREHIHPAAKIIIVVDYYHNQMYKLKRPRTESSVSYTSTLSMIESSKEKFASTMNYLHKKKKILFEEKVVDIFTDIIETERRMMGTKSVMRLAVNAIEPGMIFAEDYYTSFGMLIAAKGETITKETFNALKRFIENGEMPTKILVIK